MEALIPAVYLLVALGTWMGLAERTTFGRGMVIALTWPVAFGLLVGDRVSNLRCYPKQI